MARLTFLTAVCTLLMLLLGFVQANPVAADAPGPYKKYTPKGNRLDCPGAAGSKYTGPRGGKWGILCGWDTDNVLHKWGPFDLPFDQCIAKCGATKNCFIATWTGKCYLKGSNGGQRYVRTGRMGNKMAIKLSKRADPHVIVPH